ncbi:hypothetical protein [Actinacidiphila oryziradicis]|uniref:hypothetical protein n=1 Tax=Actinacidiphila oryziradicis TaxID=2571141 RepID=UPI0023F1D4F0|nr:hypothetical protein [Actinacidiphila oryziradicis]MCW2871263.1 hypothetical protein [Actinacidiphila oryziradicis]
MANTPTQQGRLESSICVLGGIWDPARGMTILRDTGFDPTEKYVRRIYRDLADAGLLTKIQDRPVQYRTTEQLH